MDLIKRKKYLTPATSGEVLVLIDCVCNFFNPLTGTGNYSATSNNMKLVHWLLMGGLLHLVQ